MAVVDNAESVIVEAQGMLRKWLFLCAGSVVARELVRRSTGSTEAESLGGPAAHRHHHAGRGAGAHGDPAHRVREELYDINLGAVGISKR